MALSLGTLQVDLEANTSRLTKADKEVKRISSSMESAFNRVGVAFAGIFAAESVRRLIIASDQLNVMQRRLIRFTGNADQAEKTFRKLATTASAVGSEIGNITSIFERFSLIREDIGATNSEIVQMTDTLAKLGAIGGSSGEEISNSLRQLAQGLAGGVLRAEEFNSIIEQTPEIAKAIGEEMGLSLGEMRKAMLAGELTSDKVFSAIIASAEKTNKEFEKLPKSITQSAQALTNDLLVAFNKLDEAVGGGTSSIAEFLETLRLGVQDVSGTLDPEAEAIDRINKLYERRTSLQGRLNNLQEAGANATRISNIRRELINVTKELLVEQEALAQARGKLGGEEIETILITKGATEIDTVGPSDVDREKLLEQLEFRAKVTSDANLELEAEMLRHQLALQDTFTLGSEEFTRAQGELSQLRLDRQKEINQEEIQAEIDKKTEILTQQQGQLSNLASFSASTNSIIAAAGKEGTAIAKAAFLAQKAIQIAQIFTATQLAAIQAGAASAVGGPFAFAASVGFVEATGAAAAAAVAAQTVGAFENGGIVPGNSMSGDNLIAKVNSGEMILNQGQQKQLFNMANGGGGGGGTPNVNVINNGAPLEVQSAAMSNGDLTLMVDNKIAASESRINKSLSSGRGATAQSLQKGFNAERRL